VDGTVTVESFSECRVFSRDRTISDMGRF